jgi:DNA-binding response OmpR family regulator
MPKTKLMIVDDESDLLSELTPLLERMGFAVDTASNGEQALTRIQTSAPDLIIMDVQMPFIDGREVLRRLRAANNWTPVILLSRVGTTTLDHALGLQEGADDYLNKPFDPMELIARIQAVLRRTQRPAQSLTSFRQLVSGDVVLDRQVRRAYLRGTLLTLSTRAFTLLEYLMLNGHEPISRESLLDHVWGWSTPVETRAVDIRIAELRKALEEDASTPHYIETVVGFGYRFLGKVEGK